ncbi:branched-chain amino acid transporter AzlC [Paenibacillus selenitireducens]|uniref:Branched-chain amino acid transporter AzlC n=1 Tax=Paenibacillus selenitireducens TaxID=1324314 RepID=A0A1T2X616_9BACL|nr:AzlC family ABC transporter permease [Paenibacillus selenitireducens]OPA75292.1 branched-chain amino acid transporter AzlC [Paenibacillus selenitireducens]
MSLNGPQVETLKAPLGEDSFIRGVKDCVPTLLGYLSIGFASGVVEYAAGMSIPEIALMCLLLYAGSAQFIAAGMLASGSSIFSIIFTIFFVNLRHLLLSAALSPYFRHLTPLKNMLIGSLLTDETFGVAMNESANKSRLSDKWMHGLNLTAYLNWFAANIAGALLGQWISNPEQWGLDFALPAMFIGLLVLAILNRNKLVTDIIVAICSVLIAIGVSTFTSPSIAVIAATIVASTVGMVIEKWT